MEKRETTELDLTRWIIVHETPFMGWLGRLEDGFFQGDAYDVEKPDAFADALMRQRLTLQDALVLQTTQMPIPGPGGTMQLGIITSVLPPHSFTTESILVTVMPTRVTLVRTLGATDQRGLAAKIALARQGQLQQRVRAAGIEIPTPGGT